MLLSSHQEETRDTRIRTDSTGEVGVEGGEVDVEDGGGVGRVSRVVHHRLWVDDAPRATDSAVSRNKKGG